jgi:autotransporter-associated beta strand protein
MGRSKHASRLSCAATVTSIALVILCAATPAMAQAITKANTTTMNTSADWGGTAPSSTTDGTFTNLVTAENLANMTLGDNVSLRSLIFNNINGPVTIAAGNTLTLENVTNSIRMDNANLNHDVTINAAVAGIGNIFVKSGRKLTLAGGGTGGGSAITQGAGTVEFSAGSFSGFSAVNNGDWTSPGTSGLVLAGSGTLSGNANVGNAGTGILRINGSTAQLVAPNGNTDLIVGRGNTGRGLLQLDQGTITATRNFYVGYLMTTSTASTGIFRMNAGTLSMTAGTTDGRLDILGATTAIAGEGAFELTGGTASVRRVTLGNGSSIGHARMDVTGGALFITGNSGTGIAWLGTGSATYSITLAGGTIGANGDWSSSADMKLGTTNGSITFQAASSSGTARNITLSGVLSNNGEQAGGLMKTASGTLTLSNANTFSGDTRVDGGTLALANVNAIQSSTLDIGSGSVSFTVAGTNAYTVAGLKGSGNLGLGVNTVTVGGGNTNTTFSGALSGSAVSGLVKIGLGSLTLDGASTSFTGSTTISAGRLVVGPTGSINATSGISVSADAGFDYNSSTTLTVAPSLLGSGSSNRATLGGNGTINAALTLDNLGDTLSPGNSPGIMPFGTSQTWNSFTYLWETNNFVGTTAGTDFDQIAITGSLNLTGGIGAYLLDITSLTAGNATGDVGGFSDVSRSWTILTTTAGITGFDANNWTLSTANFTSSPAATGSWELKQQGNNLVLDFIAVPEPTGMALAGCGMLFLAWRAIGQRRRSPKHVER